MSITQRETSFLKSQPCWSLRASVLSLYLTDFTLSKAANQTRGFTVWP
jgi:hypothetical protein